MTTPTVKPLNLGEITVHEKSRYTYLRNYGQSVRLAFISWFIKDEGKKILIDTGPGGEERIREYFDKIGLLGPETQTSLLRSPRSIEFCLSQIGMEPDDIDIVIFTHLHWDHCTSNALFPKATFLVQRDEIKHASCPVDPQRPMYGFFKDSTPPFARDLIRYTAIEGDLSVTKNVEIILTPGHTPGLQGVKIETSSKTLFIAGDNIPLYENWEQKVVGAQFVNLIDYYRSLRLIERISDCVIPGHDPRVFERPSFLKD